MSDVTVIPNEPAIAPPTDEAIEVMPAPPPEAQAALAAQVIAAPAAPVAELDALIDLLRRGLSRDADPMARAAAREVGAQFVQLLGGPPAGAMPSAAMAQPSPTFPVMVGPVPMASTVPPGVATPASPVAATISALRNLAPDQLLALAVQRLRAALPPGVSVAEPRGIQFSLVPMPAGSQR